MPISDLLASITGEKTQSSPSLAKSPAPPAKRKAPDDVGGSAQKVQRIVPATNGSRPNGAAANTSHSSERPPYSGSATNGKHTAAFRALPVKHVPSSTVHKPLGSPSLPSLGRTGGSKVPISANTSTRRNSPAAASRPSDINTSKAPPKKGSYAEIMARASRAQAAMGPIGKIQHKAIEKLPSKREREESKAEQAYASKKGLKHNGLKGHRGVNGGMAPKAHDADRHGNGQRSRDTDVAKTMKRPGNSSRASKMTAEEEKKIKKAAVATTGYTGTARPRPGASTKATAASKHGAVSDSRDRDRDRRPFGAFSVRPRRSDDYDEEMDDFIVDDEDDVPDDYGQHYRYADSEDESDMEAGLSDIDLEERRAEYVAKREDAAEEALEKKLKRQKEERKRLHESNRR